MGLTKKSEKLMLPFSSETPPMRTCGLGPPGFCSTWAVRVSPTCTGGVAGADAGLACVRLVDGAASPFAAPPAITSCRFRRPLAFRITRA
ncbi:hypothetical protein D9M72_519930 [compost metagenome]